MNEMVRSLTHRSLIMWQVEVEEYNRMTQESFPVESTYFRNFYDALRFIENVKASNCNCSIWLTELMEDPESTGDYIDTGNISCYQEANFA